MDLALFVVLILISAPGICSQRGWSKVNSRLNYFDIDLLRYIAEEKKGNVMISPASIKSTLAMILEGARGNTETEIRSALRLSLNKEEFREQLNVYLSLLQNNKTDAVLHNVNVVFSSNKLKLKKDYEFMLRKVYFTDIQSIDFSNPVKATEIINRWTDINTRGYISTLVDPVDVSPTSDMLLANALYFKSSWQHAFDPQLTHNDCFYSRGTCTNVAMMSMSAELNYAYVDNLRAHAVELPYEGKRYSMILLVPQDRDGLLSLIRDLPYMSLPQISQLLAPSDVNLRLPKFTVDFSDNIVPTLKSMRVTSLFSRDADLSGMYEGGSPTVNTFMHKVYLSVDEKGTVATAASSVMLIPLIGNVITLPVDRPFLFFIRDNDSGLVLFEGKIEEPTVFREEVTTEPLPTTMRKSSKTFSLKRLFG